MPDAQARASRLDWEKRSLVDQVAHVVRKSILEGQLAPGETVSITDLAGTLGVSPTPVREALHRLASDGIMLLRPARTPVVAPLAVDDLHDIYSLRLLIEVDTAARACPTLTAESDNALAQELEIIERAPPWSEDWWSSHAAFHRILLGQISARTERIITELAVACERYIRAAYAGTQVRDNKHLRSAHAPLVDAAASRDSTAMRLALREHLELTERDLVARVTEILSDKDEPPRQLTP